MPMKLTSLETLFMEELKDLYSAENQILTALPKMIRSASSSQLQQAFQQHLEQSKGHVDRLNQIFQRLNASGGGKKCLGMEGIIKDGDEVVTASGEPDAKDAALISAAQRVEHYEMAGYGSARTYAETLNHPDAARLLEQTLQEEKQADAKLTQIAESSVNVEAAAKGSR